jgi:hypothetical protein
MFFPILLFVLVGFGIAYWRMWVEYDDADQRWSRFVEFSYDWFMAFGIGTLTGFVCFPDHSNTEMLGLGSAVAFGLAGYRYWKQL